MSSIRTYQTRLDLLQPDNDILAAYCDLFLPVKLAIHKSRHAGEDLAEARKRIAAQFGLTIREYDSAATQVDGAIKSAIELRKTHARDLKVSIASIKKTIKNPKTKPKAKHQKKRRLATLEHRLSVAESKDLPSICFGTRKLFKAQHEIDPNDDAAHAEWHAEWQNARANQFLVVGDKNKIGGNLECRLTPTETGYIAHLRIPDAIRGEGEKYVTFKVPKFAYGDDAIRNAVGRCSTNLSRDDGTGREPITCRFVRDEIGFRLFVTVAVPEVKKISDRRAGAIGVDLNADHVAWCQTDYNGNPVAHGSIPLNLYGKPAGQRAHLIGLAVKELVKIAVATRLPIVVEELDFARKKAGLRENGGAKYARMLSSFMYAQFDAVLSARCFDAGIELIRVDPAYSSVIGYAKFMERYGLTVHQAAALVIARRPFSFREGVPDPAQFRVGAGDRITLPRPADQGRHVRASWGYLIKKAKAAHAGQLRSSRKRRSLRGSGPSKDGSSLPSEFSGAIPRRESVDLHGSINVRDPHVG